MPGSPSPRPAGTGGPADGRERPFGGQGAGAAKLSGWGRYPVLDCRVQCLRQQEDLPGLLRCSDSLIPRGNGRAYGDAALNPELTVSMTALDRLQAFDASTGLLTCEAGVLLADILAAFVPRGWFPPVVPGTKFVTVGGMIAADIHGKNHHRDGSFGSHVEALTLATAAGEIRQCSRTERADLFRATIGGLGLTGVILAASFRLQPIETAFILQETRPARDLDEAMAWFAESGDWPYSVAWVDCLARGARLGRSVLIRGAFADRAALPARLARDPLRAASAGRLEVPIDAPAALLNRISIGAFNGLHYQLARARAGAGVTHFDPFFFPLDRIGAWNRLYGRRGFVQYQCALPAAESAAGLALLLQRIAATGPGSFLTVLKLFGPGGEGLMSFPLQGYTLALDFPWRGRAPDLLDALDRIVLDHGGRVYLAKDARCGPEQARQGYPQRSAFDALRREAAGAPPKFASALSRRLSL